MSGTPVIGGPSSAAPVQATPNRVLLLFRKDLLRRWRSPLGVVAMIAFPLVFSGMMALAFGGGESGLPRARLLVEDRDGSLAGGLMKSFLGSDQVSAYLEVVEVGEEGRQQIEDDEASALLLIPEGTTGRLFAGEPVTLEMIRNPSQTILPEVAEQIAAVMAEVLALGARLLRSQTEGLTQGSIDSFDDIDDEDLGRLAVSLRRLLSKGQRYVSKPPMAFEVVTLSKEDEEEEAGDGVSTTVMILLIVLPGISVYALFVIGDQMMRDVLTEARLGTLRRQLSAPVTGAQILAGKVLVTAVVAGIALLILAAFAAALAPEPVDIAGFAVLSLALVLAITGFSALIYSLARTESQGATAAALLYLTLAFSGGSFLPVDNMPGVVRAVAPLSPFYWGTQGFRDLLTGADLAGVLTPVVILGGLGLLLLAAGAFLLQRRVLRGEAA